MYKTLTEQDSWLVLSAYRTGSTVVAELIKYAYLRAGIELRELLPVVPSRTDPILPKDLLKTHDISELNLVNKNTTIVVITRNPVESAISWLVKEQTGVWHFRPKEWNMWFNINTKYTPEPIDIKPFHVDPKNFIETYEAFVRFYKDLKIVLRDKNYIKIEYNEFKDQTSVLFDKLNLTPFKAIKKSLPVKTPGTPEQWIENWEEISNIIKDLNTSTI